jgi:hypothetical protein
MFAARDAVLFGGPTTYKGKKIRGLYIATEDDFLQKHPELKPYEQFTAETLGEWWDTPEDCDDQGEPNGPCTTKLMPGMLINVMYMGNERFNFFGGVDNINNEIPLYPVALGDENAYIDGKIRDDMFEYGVHFKKV